MPGFTHRRCPIHDSLLLDFDRHGRRFKEPLCYRCLEETDPWKRVPLIRVGIEELI